MENEEVKNGNESECSQEIKKYESNWWKKTLLNRTKLMNVEIVLQ